MKSSPIHQSFVSMLTFFALLLGTVNCGYLKCFSTTCSHKENISPQGAFSALYWFDLGPGSEMMLDINANVALIDMNLKLETHPSAPISFSVYSDNKHAATRSESTWAQFVSLNDCKTIRFSVLNTNSEPVTVALSVYAPRVYFAYRDFIKDIKPPGIKLVIPVIALLIVIAIAFVLFRKSKHFGKQEGKLTKQQEVEGIEITEREPILGIHNHPKN